MKYLNCIFLIHQSVVLSEVSNHHDITNRFYNLKNFNENCDDVNLGYLELCQNNCFGYFVECHEDCFNAECHSNCQRELNTCYQSCPCMSECFDGCSNCSNPVCTCSDLDNNADYQNCFSESSNELGKCILSCEVNSDCKSECNSLFIDSHEKCPCQSGCPSGCPCQDYSCIGTTTSPTTQTTESTPIEDKQVLLLSTYNFETKNETIEIGYRQPMVISFDGSYRNASFDFGTETQIFYSCPIEFKNQFFVFGGRYQQRQISKVIGCQLERTGVLPFDFFDGACGRYDIDLEDTVLLCFGNDNRKQCSSFNGEEFKAMENIESNHPHRYTFLSKYKDEPFIVGGSSGNDDYHNKAEILKIKSNKKWSLVSEYPFRSRLSNYGTISLSDRVILFGTNFYTDMSPAVVVYKNDIWTQIGTQSSARSSYGVIHNGEVAMIVGGYMTHKTEYWTINENKYDPVLMEPELYHYAFLPPATFLVNSDFCL